MLEVAQQVVYALFRDLHIGRDLARAASVGSRPAEQGHMGRADVPESSAPNSSGDALADFMQTKPKQRTDRNRRHRDLGGTCVWRSDP